MAENKKSIILYVDLIHTFEELSDEEAGRLIKHFLRYVNDLNPEPPDKLIKVVFEPIKQQLKRDLKKWKAIKKKRSDAGKASADKRQHVLTSVDKPQQTPTNPTVTVNDTVNVNDTVINSSVSGGFHADTLDKEMLLTDHQVGTTIEFIKIKSGRDVSNYQVQSQWRAFKIQVFSQHEWYKGIEDLVRHFRESIKFDIKKNGTHKQATGKNHGKSAGVIGIIDDLAREAGLDPG